MTTHTALAAMADTATPVQDSRPAQPAISIARRYSVMYIGRKLYRSSTGDSPMPGLNSCVDEVTKQQAQAECIQPCYYQWHEASTDMMKPRKPPVSYSLVRTPQDLASLLLYLQVAVFEKPTGELADSFGHPDDAPMGHPALFVGVVGDRIGRYGRGCLAMMTIMVSTPKLHHLFVVDAVQLGGAEMALDTTASWTVRREQLQFRRPLHPQTVEQREAVAAGEWKGYDNACFAPVEVAVQMVLPLVPSFYTPKTPIESRRLYRQAGVPQLSLRRLLEAGGVTKVFFDARHTADMLFDRHQVRLRGVLDLQLIEVAARPRGSPVDYVCGLETCLRKSHCVPPPVMDAWTAVRQNGRLRFQAWDDYRAQRLQNPQMAPVSSVAPFHSRPLDATLLKYAINNVLHLETLLDHYRPLVDMLWIPCLAAEMAGRIVCINATRTRHRTNAAQADTAQTDTAQADTAQADTAQADNTGASSSSPNGGLSGDSDTSLARDTSPDSGNTRGRSSSTDLSIQCIASSSPRLPKSPERGRVDAWFVATAQAEAVAAKSRSPWPHPNETEPMIARDRMPYFCTQEDAELMSCFEHKTWSRLIDLATAVPSCQEDNEVTRPSRSARRRWARKLRGG